MWDPTEAAIITMANKAQYDTDKIKKSYKRIWEYWFDSSRKMMSTACEIDGKKIIYVKWAIKNILDKCTKIFDWKQIKKITQKDKDRIIQNIDKFSIDAMRNISLAYKIIDKNIISMNMQETESDLVFLWFASIIDPPREEVPNAIYSAYQANIKIIMITWDYWLTAEAIAKKIWLSPGNKEILMIKWEEIRKKTDIQLLYDLRNPYIIFSRTSPEDKMRIVSLLKKENNIVAVTWDWVNDAPALKEANIWVSMWRIWTDVAKDASEIVLLDDSFSTLVNAIREWRIIYQNLKKTIISSLTSNGGELFAILISLLVKAFWHIPIAINPFQILAVDLIWEMWPLMMLTHDSAKPWLMQDKPRDVKNHLLNKKTILNLIIFWSLMWIIAFIAYISYFLIHNIYPFDLSTSSLNYMTGTSVTYTTIILCQYMNILSRRTWIDSIFNKYTLTNKKLWLSFFWWVLLVSILIYNPHISKYFWFWAMWIVDRLLPISWWIIYLIVREIKKYINRKNTQDNK
jgi:Ca2+-transporting ATPase